MRGAKAPGKYLVVVGPSAKADGKTVRILAIFCRWLKPMVKQTTEKQRPHCLLADKLKSSQPYSGIDRERKAKSEWPMAVPLLLL
jgi:hypothetical protein